MEVFKLQIHVVSYTVAMEVQMVQSFLLLTTHLTVEDSVIHTEGEKSKVQKSGPA